MRKNTQCLRNGRFAIFRKEKQAEQNHLMEGSRADSYDLKSGRKIGKTFPKVLIDKKEGDISVGPDTEFDSVEVDNESADRMPWQNFIAEWEIFVDCSDNRLPREFDLYGEVVGLND